MQIDEELVQTDVKEMNNDDKVLQAQRENILVCNTDEGQRSAFLTDGRNPQNF